MNKKHDEQSIWKSRKSLCDKFEEANARFLIENYLHREICQYLYTIIRPQGVPIIRVFLQEYRRFYGDCNEISINDLIFTRRQNRRMIKIEINQQRICNAFLISFLNFFVSMSRNVCKSRNLSLMVSMFMKYLYHFNIYIYIYIYLYIV